MSGLRHFKRTHYLGTEARITEHEQDVWHIRIDLKESGHAMTVVGFVATSLDQAKELAHQEILKHGHVCNRSCRDWEQF